MIALAFSLFKRKPHFSTATKLKRLQEKDEVKGQLNP